MADDESEGETDMEQIDVRYGEVIDDMSYLEDWMFETKRQT